MVNRKSRQSLVERVRSADSPFATLADKICRCQAKVSIIGLGYVGLPLAVVFAEAGYSVVGIDIDRSRVDKINRGESDISDVPSESLSRLTSSYEMPSNGSMPDGGEQSVGKLTATCDFDVLEDADVAIVCVPTPLGKTRDPDTSYIASAAEDIARYLHPGMLVVLESTTYPGTTEEVILPRLERANYRGSDDKQSCALSVGTDFFLAFSPERIDPGRTDWTVHNTPKVVGGMTPACTELTKALYERAIQNVVPVSSPRVAEMVKLLENTFRATNIALVNEIAIICDRLGVSVWEVINAAKTKPFGYMPFYPGPGLGGHCIPIDPQYLAWKMKTLNYNARFIQLAEEINFGMPAYVAGKVADALNEDGKPLKDSQILVLGVAYKADVSDVRESPALEIIRLLQQKKAEVSYHDPYVAELRADGISMSSVSLDLEKLKESDCVVITTAHKSYDWKWVVEHSKLVVDTRNATEEIAEDIGRVLKL